LPESRLPMRKTREVLRLHYESHLVPGQIASICKVSRSTVQRYFEPLKAAGLSWPLPAELDDVALERRLFPPPPARHRQNVVCRTARRFIAS
jgi:DNA-binding transcriptional regulator LsrR (DeoR family)